MSEIILKSVIDMELIDHMGSDQRVVEAMLVSTQGGRSALLAETEKKKNEGRVRALVNKRHGTPFEHCVATFRISAPIKVFREWHRHRIGWCLSGDTEIVNETFSPNSGRTIRKRRIDELWRNWHQGVPDSLGRTRLLPSCRNLPLRVLNEQTNFFEIGRMNDIIQSGVKELLGVCLEDGKQLKCSKDHQILTSDGWAKAGDLRGGEQIAVVGKRSAFAGRQIPPSLRRGIGVWTSMQRQHLIKPWDVCYVCHETFRKDGLLLDHVIPVASDLLRALDVTNLKPICSVCNRRKTNSEQKLARRCNVAGSKWVRLKERPFAVGEEMTYDISMDGPHHNFVANGIVVHNSYNEESGRYKQLEPVFWLPPRERPLIEVENFKAMSPDFRVATEEEYQFLTVKLQSGYSDAYEKYESLLRAKFDKGVARDVLGVGIFSSMYATCNARSLMHFLELRTKVLEGKAKRPSSPLWEINNAASQVEEIFKTIWPFTWSLWDANGRMAP